MRKIRWGIIGCGDVTEVKSGPAFQKAKNSELVAVMRRNGELAKDYAKRHNVPKWYCDAEKLINDPDVDAVYISTPPAFHIEYTLMTAKAGKPVYVEKPMALNTKECEEMIEACKNAGVPLYVAYYRRALERFLKIKELVDSKTIGEVHCVNVCFHDVIKELPANLPWRVKPEISGGGHFVDLASHMLDFLDFVFGPIKQVKGIATNQTNIYPAEDIVTGTFLFENGIHGTGTWCFNSFERLDQTEIVGDKGKITYSTFDAEPIKLTSHNGTIEFNIDYPQHIQQSLIQMVVDDLTGNGKCPSTGETAIRTTWVMEEMLKDYYGK